MSGMGIPGMDMGMGGAVNPKMQKQSILQFMADGIKSKVPDADVKIVDDGLEVVFTKDTILRKIFQNTPELSRMADVNVDTRGIVVLVRV